MSQQINLFNPVFLKQEKYFSAATMAIGLALVLVACIAVVGIVGYQSVVLAQQASTTAALVKTAETQLQRLAGGGAPEKSPALEAEIAKAEAELSSLRQVSDVLNRGEMGNTQGYANYLRAFARQIISGVWLTGFSIQGAGSDITIEGRALQPSLIPAYVGRLRTEPVMQGKAFGSLDIREPAPAASKDGAARLATPPYVAFSLQSASSKEAGAKSP